MNISHGQTHNLDYYDVIPINNDNEGNRDRLVNSH